MNNIQGKHSAISSERSKKSKGLNAIMLVVRVVLEIPIDPEVKAVVKNATCEVLSEDFQSDSENFHNLNEGDLEIFLKTDEACKLLRIKRTALYCKSRLN